MARPLLLSGRVRNSRAVLTAGLGGIAGTVLDVATLVALVETGTHVVLASFLGAAAGAGVCFSVNKYWAFRDRSPLSLRQVSSFGLVSVGTALLMALTMAVTVLGLRLPYLAAKAICAASVFLFWSYPAQRRFVFRRPVLPIVPDDVIDDVLDDEPYELDYELDPARSAA